MMPANQISTRSRVPNGSAKHRVGVALSDDVFENLMREAEETRRTASSLVAIIVADYFANKKES
jgi:hypothetical protein